MNIKINYQNSEDYINNIAFIKALLIKCNIESSSNTFEEKEKILSSVLNYLKSNK